MHVLVELVCRIDMERAEDMALSAFDGILVADQIRKLQIRVENVGANRSQFFPREVVGDSVFILQGIPYKSLGVISARVPSKELQLTGSLLPRTAGNMYCGSLRWPCSSTRASSGFVARSLVSSRICVMAFLHSLRAIFSEVGSV